MKPQKAVTDILEEVCTEICTHYCKYPEECERKAAGDGDLASGMLTATFKTAIARYI